MIFKVWQKSFKIDRRPIQIKTGVCCLHFREIFKMVIQKQVFLKQRKNSWNKNQLLTKTNFLIVDTFFFFENTSANNYPHININNNKYNIKITSFSNKSGLA